MANQNAFNQVRPPILGPAPVAPQRRTRMEDNSDRDLMFGLAGAAMDGLSAYAGALPNGGNGSPFDINKLFSANQGSQMAKMILGSAAGNGTTSVIPQAGALNGFGLQNTGFTLPGGLVSGSYSTMFDTTSPFGPTNFNPF